MEFIINHMDEILVIITSIVTAASTICALTPTPKDDTVMAKIRRYVDILALNVGKAKVAAS